MVAAAANAGDANLVRMLISGKVEDRQRTLDVALLAASSVGHADVVITLLTSGADVGAGAAERMSCDLTPTPLLAAVEGGHCHVAELLLTSTPGADVNESNDFDTSPLMIAAKMGDLPMVELLLESGAAADINAQDFEGRSALMLAASHSLEIVTR